MYKTLEVKDIEVKNEGTMYMTESSFNAEVVKIVIILEKENFSQDGIIKIYTSDGELLVEHQGNESQIYYPKNWSAQHKRYQMINVIDEGSSASMENFVNFGHFMIKIENAKIGDIVKMIAFGLKE